MSLVDAKARGHDRAKLPSQACARSIRPRLQPCESGPLVDNTLFAIFAALRVFCVPNYDPLRVADPLRLAEPPRPGESRRLLHPRASSEAKLPNPTHPSVDQHDLAPTRRPAIAKPALRYLCCPSATSASNQPPIANSPPPRPSPHAAHPTPYQPPPTTPSTPRLRPPSPSDGRAIAAQFLAAFSPHRSRDR